VLAHELKSPIAAVEGYLRIMSSRLKGDDISAYEHMVERSLLRLEGMRKLVMDMLDLTRMESGQKLRLIEEVDTAQAARHAMESVAPAAQARAIKLECKADPALKFPADRTEMDIVLNNLLSNAVKYNKDGGSVSLEISATKEGGLLISCEDTGIGMTPEETVRLFGEFVRIKNEETKGILGSGLGLSILKKVAALYGGDTETRVRQEILLGVGGVRLLRSLGYEPSVFHMNEGHAALLGLELLDEHAQHAGRSGFNHDDVVAVLRGHWHRRGIWVFCDELGKPLCDYKCKKPLWRACRGAGLRRISWHVLRHTFASHLVMRVGNVMVLHRPKPAAPEPTGD